MNRKNSKVDLYLADGCGRCKLGGTPACKVKDWQEELKQLRLIVLSCGLTEELKWSFPCYTYQGNNILILAVFKEYCSLNFFKGALLKDVKSVLVKAGDNTQSARQFRFSNKKEITEKKSLIKAYIEEAIKIEEAGLKVELNKKPEPIPEEFQKQLDKSSALKTAFYKLTPGRQRAYILHFSAPKQSKTRDARIEKCIPQILKGIGFNDY